MRSVLTVHAEASLGAHIDDVAAHAVRLAGKLDCCVEIGMNSVMILAYPGDDWRLIARSFHHELRSKHGTRIAAAHLASQEPS